MPKSWHDRHTVHKIDDDNQRTFYRNIVADKKPYFMRYIYPDLMRQYNTYIKNTNRNALRKFQMTVDEMRSTPYEQLNDEQINFLKYYEQRMPVGTEDCVMNKICKRFEEEFDGYISKHNSSKSFDYSIMKSDSEYSMSQYYSIKKLYEDYNKQVKNYISFANCERIDKLDMSAELINIDNSFRQECDSVCPNAKSLCNILLDICYNKKATKKFVWSMCADTIIDNLLEKNNNTISFPILDSTGDISYCGNRYSIKEKEIEEEI